MKRGKLENIENETRKLNVRILSLSEARWKEEGEFESQE